MVRVLLVNETLLMCNVISAALDDEKDIHVVGSGTSITEALEMLREVEVDVILVSTRLPDQGALTLTQKISENSPDIKVVVLGLTDSKEHVLQYVEAGAIGYVLKDDSVEDLASTIRAANQERALVSPKIAAALMERVSELAQLFAQIESSVIDEANLTPRELEVLQLIGQGLTNQEIADKLFIEVGTVKNHVHNILEKLDVSSRDDAATYLAILD